MKNQVIKSADSNVKRVLWVLTTVALSQDWQKNGQKGQNKK